MAFKLRWNATPLSGNICDVCTNAKITSGHSEMDKEIFCTAHEYQMIRLSKAVTKCSKFNEKGKKEPTAYCGKSHIIELVRGANDLVVGMKSKPFTDLPGDVQNLIQRAVGTNWYNLLHTGGESSEE